MNKVLATFKVNDKVRNEYHYVLIHICIGNPDEILRSFTFEPCKIAYVYKGACLRMAHWFMKMGPYCKEEINNCSEETKDIAKRYEIKGFNYDNEKRKSGDPVYEIPENRIKENTTKRPSDDDNNK